MEVMIIGGKRHGETIVVHDHATTLDFIVEESRDTPIHEEIEIGSPLATTYRRMSCPIIKTVLGYRVYIDIEDESQGAIQ